MNVILPKTVKVGGFDYTIEVGDHVDRELEAKDAYGDQSLYLRRIRLTSTLPSQHLSSALVHELLHAVDAVYNDAGLDERTVTVLAHGLCQVLEQLKVKFALGKEKR